MARLLLLGGSGMAGVAARAVLGRSHRIEAPGRARFDIAEHDVRALPLDDIDVVVNLAGVINKRSADDDQMTAINAVFPHQLAGICAERGIALIHVSTDCVFSGAKGPHFEDETPDAPDAYGISKRNGEPQGALVLRTSMIGPEENNFYNLLCWTLAQESLTGFTDHLWNGVTTLTLARCLDTIIGRGMPAPGLFHLHGEDTTKHDLVRLICRAFGHPAAITAAPSGQPRDMRLASRYPEFLRSLPIPSLAEQIVELPRFADRRGHWR